VKGESFADVARALSEHAASAQRGGSIGAVARPNLPAPLAEAAFSIEVGKYTEPLKTDDGYFILKVDARTAGSTRSFDEVKDALREGQVEWKLQQAYVAWLKEARDKAVVERKWRP
jgi:parvulin-like peptidyl-prolyl isomerase